MLKRFGFISFMCLIFTGCIGFYGTYSQPYLDDYDYLGNWSGELDDSVVGKGSLTAMVISDSDTSGSLSGSWEASFEGGIAEGVFTGNSYAQEDIYLQLFPASAPSCMLSVTASRTENTVSGVYKLEPYQAETCDVATFGVGTISLTKN